MLYIYSVLAYLENLWICLILFWLYLISISIINRILTPSEESAFTARPKINLKSQIFRCDQSIFCLPNLPIFSDFFDLCLHWVCVPCTRIYFQANCSEFRISCLALGCSCITDVYLKSKAVTKIEGPKHFLSVPFF